MTASATTPETGPADAAADRHPVRRPTGTSRTTARISGFARHNSLTIVAFGLFLAVWMVGQALTGWHVYNDDQRAHGGSSLQNWQSEFLAVASIVVLTIFLRQQGSPESKPVHAPHASTGS